MDSTDFIRERRLGAGAFGVVWLVKSRRDNKRYAVKEQETSSTVQNEVTVLRKMDAHPNVVAYYGCWREGNRVCILMEYATRGSLHDFMKLSRDPISEEDAIYLFSQILLGINHIHRESLIHRDLKPANVMLDRVVRNGRSIDVIKIGDFGISKDVGRSIAKTAIGTKIYMAPETFSGETYNSQCDMWSSGIILYELLTKQYPFAAGTVRDMVTKIQQGRAARIPSGRFTETTATMIHRLLTVDPEKRPHSTQLLNDTKIKNWNKVIGDFLDNDHSIQVNEGLISKPVQSNNQMLSPSRTSLKTCDVYGGIAKQASEANDREVARRNIPIVKLNLKPGHNRTRMSSSDSDSSD